ncbi:putative small nucleolar ribonucleoprotein complex subunit [Phaeomoniella chlamydospora]|uniref:Putative small nucleolar ribonucleoprotein complex subunit n=1 Tax=Phaeomoniella chlamydospora TaxID=158046 RepID=A0A0G2F2L5_PHACM|nr:putative small nucleolar ribonucleoprotein complex subunit [Phaeomoniella chlamydospora]
MAAKVEVKTTFEPTRTIEPIYTGGDVSLDASGNILASCVEEDVLIVNLKTGQPLARIEGDGEAVTSLVLSASAAHLVIFSRSLSMRIYYLREIDEAGNLETVLQRTLKPHSAPIVTATIDRTGTLLAAGCADGTVKVWDLNGGFATHTFHGHGGVVSAVKFFPHESTTEAKSNQLTRKRSQDGTRKPGSGSLDVTAGFFLASGSEDGKIRIWDLQKRKSIATLDSHVSVVRAIDHSREENALLSCSRDKTLIIWDCRTWKTRKVIPTLELVESAGFAANGLFCYSGGEYGRLRLWDATAGREITKGQEAGTENDSIIATHKPEDAEFVLSVHVDQTLRLHSTAALAEVSKQSKVDSLPVIQRISGNHDEVIDLARLGPDRSLLGLATNTESIRVVSLATTRTEQASCSFGEDVALLEGHSDIIICVDVDWSGHWLATGAKDNTARLWRIDPASNTFKCAAVFSGHAESLGAIALPHSSPPAGTPSAQNPLSHPPEFLLTGSQDRTVKRWDTSKIKLNPNSSQPQTGIRALFTRVAHEKDINAIDVSPTTPIFASASQDRTVKISSLEDGSVMGILRGHKRGVWSIRFAPKDTPLINTGDGASSSSRGVIVSGSGDRTVKVWSLSTYTCLLTFEGHSNSVLKVVWLYPPISLESSNNDDIDEPSSRSRSSHNQQHPLIASASSDSLIKIWSPYNTSSSYSALDSASLLTTLDNHTDRVWALTSHPQSPTNPYPLISGGADATITCWTDTTSSTAQAATRAAEERVEQDQALQNHIHARNWREVITLCLQLNHPGRLLRVFQDVMASSSPTTTTEENEKPITGSLQVDRVLSSLSSTHLLLLLQRLRDWNTNARTAPVAQTILHCLLKNYSLSTFINISQRRKPGSKNTSTPLIDANEAIDDTEQTSKSKPVDLKSLVRALEVYTERHYKRIEDLIDESYVVDYTLREMDEILGMGAVDGDGDLEGMGNGDVMRT